MKKKGILVIAIIVIVALLVAIFAITRPTSMEKIMKKNNVAVKGDYVVLDIGKTTTNLDDIKFAHIEKHDKDYKAMMKAIRKADLKKGKKAHIIKVEKGACLINIKESKDSDLGIRFYVNSENEVQFDNRLYSVKNDVDLYDAVNKVYKKAEKTKESKE